MMVYAVKNWETGEVERLYSIDHLKIAREYQRQRRENGTNVYLCELQVI